jgi:hypothetical protein
MGAKVTLPAAAGPTSMAAFGQAVDQAAAQMDAVGIAKAIVFPPPSREVVFDYPAGTGIPA